MVQLGARGGGLDGEVGDRVPAYLADGLGQDHPGRLGDPQHEAPGPWVPAAAHGQLQLGQDALGTLRGSLEEANKLRGVSADGWMRTPRRDPHLLPDRTRCIVGILGSGHGQDGLLEGPPLRHGQAGHVGGVEDDPALDDEPAEGRLEEVDARRLVRVEPEDDRMAGVLQQGVDPPDAVQVELAPGGRAPGLALRPGDGLEM